MNDNIAPAIKEPPIVNAGSGEGGVNTFLATISGAALLLIVSYAAFNPSAMQGDMKAIQDNISRYFGWWYILLNFIFVTPVFIIPFTKWGGIKLGDADERPEYTTFEWMAMLICCSFAVSAVVWAIAEPLYHWMQPPLGAEPGSMAALKDSFKITIMHTAVGGFGVFAVAGVCIGLPAYRYGLPMNFTTAFYGLFGKKIYNKTPAMLLELIAMIVNFLGIATSIGLGMISLRYGIQHLFGVQLDTVGMIGLTCVIAAGFCWSVYRGLDNGIKTLSNINAYIAMVVFAYVLFAGPTRNIFNWIVQVPGEYFGNFVFLSLHTDAGEQAFDGKWMSWWKVFYWGWWFSWVPFVGGFLARISRGRSLREVLLVCTFIPTLTCIVWFTTFGIAGVYTEMGGNSVLWTEIQKDVGAGFYVMVDNWPLGYTFSMVVLFMMVVFMVTSADSAAFFCAMQLTDGSAEPGRIVRMTAGSGIAVLAVVLILVGGLKGCQSAAVLGGFPISVLMVFMLVSFWKLMIAEGNRLGFTRYY